MEFRVERVYHIQPYLQPRLGRNVRKTVYNITHNITGRFSMDDVDDEVNEMFRQIVEDAMADTVPEDTVSIELEPGEDYPSSAHPLFMGYFRRGDYDHRMFMQKLSMISQSNESFFLQGLIQVKVAVVSPIEVQGHPSRSRKAPRDRDQFTRSKCKTIYEVYPDNYKSCGYWAIALGFKYHELYQGGRKSTDLAAWKNFQKNRKGCLREAAQSLCKQARLSYTDTCNFNHIRMIDETIAKPLGIQIVVVEPKPPTLKCIPPPLIPSPFDIRIGSKFLGLEYTCENDRGHVRLITSFTSYYEKEYFCVRCWKGDQSKKNHVCRGSCRGCGNTVTCIEDPIKGKTRCSDCGILCFNQSCMTLHKSSKNCEKWMGARCSKCLLPWSDGQRESHKCFVKYCKSCDLEYKVTPHHCCVKKLDLNKMQEEDAVTKIFVFFDIETRQDVQINRGKLMKHIPTLLISQTLCDYCLDPNTAEKFNDECTVCGKLENRFDGDLAVKLFGDWLFDMFANRIEKLSKQRKEKMSIYVYAHNFMRFDGHFILDYLWSRKFNGIEIVMNGRKIMLIRLGMIKMVDSLCIFQQRLESLPASFGFQDIVKKGYFPYLYDRKENVLKGNVPMPAIEMFAPQFMKENAREKFLKWYQDHKKDTFNLEENRLAYCRNDVEILRRAILTYRNMFQEVTGIDPLTRRFTLPAIGLEYFRANMSESTKIGITPIAGYIPEINSSFVCSAWLDWEQKKLGYRIDREQQVGPYKADGLDWKTNTIYEFWGCLNHGCDKCVTDEEIASARKTTRSKLKEHMKQKLTFYEGKFNVIQRWEHDPWDSREMAVYVTKRSKVWSNIKQYGKEGIKESFFGGRVNFTKLSHVCESDERIRYLDFLSLYPTVLFNSKFPVGHPIVITEDISEISADCMPYFGFICCKILPPEKLNLPVLPTRIDRKLFFTCCSKCAVEKDQDMRESCKHSDEERSLKGIWTTAELTLALEKGYIFLEVYAVYHFESWDDGIFKDYIRTWLKVKQESSGWPDSTIGSNDQESRLLRNEYLNKWFNDFGILLDSSAIQKNPAKRSMAKLKLNSLWVSHVLIYYMNHIKFLRVSQGKFGQRRNLTQTAICFDKATLDEVINPDRGDIVICNELEIGQEGLQISYKFANEEDAHEGMTSYQLVSFVTSYARVMLYKMMDQVETKGGEGSVLYYDTDSIIFVEKIGANLIETGETLGCMTDEVISETNDPGAYICRAGFTAPKSYYLVYKWSDGKESTVIKVKGISLHSAAAKVLSEKSMNNLISEFPNTAKFIRVPQSLIYSTSKNCIVSAQTSKMFRIVTGKRMMHDDGTSHPYGYKRIHFVDDDSLDHDDE